MNLIIPPPQDSDNGLYALRFKNSFLDELPADPLEENYCRQIKGACFTRVKPKPIQQPHPPSRVGVTSAETFKIIGQLGYPIFINPSRAFALSDLSPYIEEYLKSWREAGHVGDGEVGLRVPIYVSDTEAKAYEEPRESALASITSLAERVAVSASREGTTGNWQAES